MFGLGYVLEIDFSGGFSGKETPANAGDIRDVGLILGSGRSLEEEMAAHSNILFFFFLALVSYICCNECTNVNTILLTKRPTVYVKAPSLCCIFC